MGVWVCIEADVALVKVELPTVAVTANVYEYCALSVKVKVMLGAVPVTLNPVVITVPPLFTVYVYVTPVPEPPVHVIDITPAAPAVAVTVPKGLMVVIEADVALVKVELPTVAVTANVYE